MTMGKRIKQARERLELTQDQLAKKVGCSRNLVTMWEADRVDHISGKYLPKLAKALGESIEWIQSGVEVKLLPKPRLTEENSDEDASLELQILRNHNSIKSLRFIVGAMATIMAAIRPEEAAAVTALLRSQPDIREYIDSGLGKELMDAIDEAVAVSSRRRGAA
jgi:transcriptional regulator with XRE-family HTH domain